MKKIISLSLICFLFCSCYARKHGRTKWTQASVRTFIFLLFFSVSAFSQRIVQLTAPGFNNNYQIIDTRVKFTAIINASGDLIITFTDGTVINAGHVTGLNGVTPNFIQGNTYDLPSDSASYSILRNTTGSTYAIDFYIRKGKDGTNGSGGGGMPEYNSMLDLLNATNFTTSSIKSFHSGYNLGGDIFDPVQSATVDYYMVYKSLANPAWYWRRRNSGFFIDPVRCGALGSTKTLGNLNYTQTQINNLFAQMLPAPLTVNTGTWVDKAAFNSMERYKETGLFTAVMASPLMYQFNDMLVASNGNSIKGYETELYYNFMGGKAILNGTTSYSWFFRTLPTSVNDALTKIGVHYVIENLFIEDNSGTVNKTGIDINSTFNSEINHVAFNSLQRIISLRFCLQTTLKNIMKTNSIQGIYFGFLPASVGGNWYNSNSNVSKITDYRCFNSNSSAWDIYDDGTDGLKIINHTTEGTLVDAPVIYDGAAGANTVSKNLFIDGVHFETTGGASCYLRVNQMRDGIITLYNFFGQYKCYVIDVTPAYGFTTIKLNDVPYAIANTDGKFFKITAGANGGGTKWEIHNWIGQSTLSGQTLSNYFAGITPLWCPAGGCGWNLVEGRTVNPCITVKIPKWNPEIRKVILSPFTDCTQPASSGTDTLNQMEVPR